MRSYQLKGDVLAALNKCITRMCLIMLLSWCWWEVVSSVFHGLCSATAPLIRPPLIRGGGRLPLISWHWRLVEMWEVVLVICELFFGRLRRMEVIAQLRMIFRQYSREDINIAQCPINTVIESSIIGNSSLRDNVSYFVTCNIWHHV